MSIPRNMQEELEKRDEIILALEMLMVDQACRLLALEAVVVNMAEAKNVKAADVKSRIAQESKRFHQHFEGEGMSGFIERAQRIAKDMSGGPKGGKTAKKPAAKKPAAKKFAKKPAAKKPAKKPAAKKPAKKTKAAKR